MILFIPGAPVPGGSKKGWIVHQRGCPAARRYNRGQCACRARVAMMDSAGERNKRWRYVISATTLKFMRENGLAMMQGPLRTEMVFSVQRPKLHLNKQGTVRNGAPFYPCVKPDAVKLARAAEDALNGILWRDDSQIVDTRIRKEYAGPGQQTGLYLHVFELKPPVLDPTPQAVDALPF